MEPWPRSVFTPDTCEQAPVRAVSSEPGPDLSSGFGYLGGRSWVVRVAREVKERFTAALPQRKARRFHWCPVVVTRT